MVRNGWIARPRLLSQSPVTLLQCWARSWPDPWGFFSSFGVGIFASFHTYIKSVKFVTVHYCDISHSTYHNKNNPHNCYNQKSNYYHFLQSLIHWFCVFWLPFLRRNHHQYHRKSASAGKSTQLMMSFTPAANTHWNKSKSSSDIALKWKMKWEPFRQIKGRYHGIGLLYSCQNFNDI